MSSKLKKINRLISFLLTVLILFTLMPVSNAFAATYYTIYKGSPTGGSYSAPSSGAAGSTITISSITPYTGYSIDSVRVVRRDNGMQLTVSGSGSSRTFTMPYCAVTINVSFNPKSYTIVKTTPSHGSFTVPTSGKTGYTITISSITPSSGYKIGTVSVKRNDTGAAITVSGSGSSRTFKMPAYSVTVSVTFSAIYYTINKSNPPEGTYSVPSSATGGSTVTISSIDPDPGYSIDAVHVVRNDNGIELTVSGSGSSRTFSMPYCAVTVNVSFKPNSYTITKSTPTNGSFTVPTSGKTGYTITISSITPSSGYSIGTVSVKRNDTGTALTVSGSGSSRTFKMPPCSVTVSVTFSAIPYTIHKSNPSEGSYSVPSSATGGSTVTISSITPDLGYEIDRVSVVRYDNGIELTVSGSGSSRTFSMPYCDVVVNVSFKVASYDIVKGTPANGSYTVPSSGTAGSTITISSITPSFGYDIDMVRVVRNDNGIELTVSGSGNSRTFTMPYCDVTVNVSFKAISYTIHKSIPSEGSYSVPSSATGGSTVTISSITPDFGYEIDSVSVVRYDNGIELTVSGSGSSRTFSMPYCDVVVNVSFKVASYDIVKGTPENGSYTVPSSGTAGSTITISSITPDFGYDIDTVRVVRNDNGIELTVSGSGSSRTFSMPYCDVTVNVSFKAIYDIIKSAPENGSFEVPAAAAGGSTITISNITPDTGFSIDRVSVVRNDNGIELTVSGSGNSRTFTMPYCDVTVNVSFGYMIVKSTPEHGSFTVPAFGNPGSTITISSITPDFDYSPCMSIDMVRVVRNDNGTELTVSGSGNSRTFIMPYCDVTVSVTFKVKHEWDPMDDSCLVCDTRCGFDTFIDVTGASVSGSTMTINYRVLEEIPEGIDITLGYECYPLGYPINAQKFDGNGPVVYRDPGSYSYTLDLTQDVAIYIVKGQYRSWFTSGAVIYTTFEDYCFRLPVSTKTAYHVVTQDEVTANKIIMPIIGGAIGLLFLPETLPFLIGVAGGVVLDIGMGLTIPDPVAGQVYFVTSEWEMSEFEGYQFHVHAEVYANEYSYDHRNDPVDPAPYISVNDFWEKIDYQQ